MHPSNPSPKANIPDNLQAELVLNAELSPAERRRAQRLAQEGKLNRIRPGILTPLPKKDWPSLIARHRSRVLGALFPGAVVGFRSAYEGAQPVEGRIYLNYTYSRVAQLPGLKVALIKGRGQLDGDMPLHPTLFMAGECRQLLENLIPNRGKDKKAAGESAVETRLVTTCESRGEAALLQIRDKSRELAPLLGRQREARQLDGLIGAILGTRSAHILTTKSGRAAAHKVDSRRMELLGALVTVLNGMEHPAVLDGAAEGDARIHAALYESYFSNYIEGTKFTIEEASEIVLKGKAPRSRPKDTKDIQGVFRQANEPGWRVQTLSSGKSVLGQLRVRHEDLMKARPEVEPGSFKTKDNRAGGTEFVRPDLVVATLTEGSTRLPQVSAGFPRAVLAHFLVAEVHPFLDGNGRVARLVMNAELSAAGLCRIIIPSISREDYIGALRLASREGNFLPLIRHLATMQRWTASFEYTKYKPLLAAMERCHAFQEDISRFRLGWPDAKSS